MKGRKVEEGKLKKEFGILLGLLVIICSGIWVYTEWDLRRFEETLPSPPARQPATGEASPGQHKASPREKPETPLDAVTPSPPNVVDPPNRNRVGGAESQPLNAAVVSEAAKNAHDRERLLDELLEDTQSDTFTDVFEEAPYDEAVVKAGFDDYNAYLATDPEYAYQRLDDAFREQYGDDPDVDIIVDRRELNAGRPEQLIAFWTELDKVLEEYFVFTSLKLENAFVDISLSPLSLLQFIAITQLTHVGRSTDCYILLRTLVYHLYLFFSSLQLLS